MRAVFFSACPCAASWGRLVGLYFGLGPNCAERGTAKQLGWADGMEGWRRDGWRRELESCSRFPALDEPDLDARAI